jgi:hypothetical protein
MDFILDSNPGDLMFSYYSNNQLDIHDIKISHETKPVLLDDFVLLVKELQMHDHKFLKELYYFSNFICLLRNGHSPEYENYLYELHYHFYVLLRLYYDIPWSVKKEDQYNFEIRYTNGLASKLKEDIDYLEPMKQFNSGQWYIFGSRFELNSCIGRICILPEIEIINPNLSKRKLDP